jgi:hypothetical protein
MDRLELHLPFSGPDVHACVMHAGECGPLPAGSVLSPEGVFYWYIDAAFRGSFPLRFWSAAEEVDILLSVQPRLIPDHSSQDRGIPSLSAQSPATELPRRR